ncbi:M20/M25/M40 family metallo-hydrolase [Undibacterium flavidum]|uniref:M28 family peptidase n=1 Tax=Undibacterium flavidum TaxID=2762297 RepID=A0ABR6YDY1_9BURK|nr:M20/M25/M40 family metallo-hydrolase [Undibacterium flavidum]MBC3874751.1 M28 family peptidase [Undibacterium flavidum]
MHSQIRRFSILICISLSWMTTTCLAQNSMSQAMQDLQVLSSEQMQGREIGSPGSALARNYILKRIAELGLKPCATAYVQDFKASRPSPSSEGKNIIACQFSEDKAAKYLVISAHYDHLGINYNKIYFGADDNASGVAGVLAVAQSLKDKVTKHHIVYAFFDGEEQGLQGAHAFVKQAWIPRKEITANLNFDMIARGDKNELFVSGTYHNPELKPLLQDLNGVHGIKVTFDHDKPDQGNDDWTPQSDHFAFFQAGIPHLYFGVEDHVDYHKATDKFEKVNPQFFDGAIAILQKAVQLVDQQFVRKN